MMRTNKLCELLEAEAGVKSQEWRRLRSVKWEDDDSRVVLNDTAKKPEERGLSRNMFEIENI